MKSNTYVLTKINELANAIPQLTIRYEYDQSCDSHFVEVSPINEFESNKKYIALEKEIRLEFINLFPFDILTFISEDDGIVLECPILIKSKFRSKETNKKFDLEDIISALFKDYIVDWPNTSFEKIQNPEVYTIADTTLETVKLDYDCDSIDNDYLLAA
ncbi:hypothetical protein [Flavobacterium pectinovorum]|uniref:Uncharacterized protein n=1 Tax=Flavobacterium pectinovorum TaxID=29533 RepID=A0AB36NZI6_9FLAO|nr:hypothetical protein [Flavobacterium pectinovorum]OXB03711.1 hypothetical protein B0A72_14495 [Flavobacterium pectinovorum]SHL64125.1 hypothetical protein SAMN05444387_1129 [Flavobacterium pectinovorum]